MVGGSGIGTHIEAVLVKGCAREQTRVAFLGCESGTHGWLRICGVFCWKIPEIPGRSKWEVN